MKKKYHKFNLRFYSIVVFLLLIAITLSSKLIYIQVVEGDKYKKIAEKRTLKNVIVKPIPRWRWSFLEIILVFFMKEEVFYLILKNSKNSNLLYRQGLYFSQKAFQLSLF